MEAESPPPDTHDAATPTLAEPQQPRLGILHLLVLTACVAAYLGITRTHMDGFSPPTRTLTALWGLNGIGSGAALAGLLLFLARRFRGLPFPRHPGEYLLVVMGVGVAAEVGSLWAPVTTMLLMLGVIVFFIWAVIRVKVFRWRFFFLASFLLTIRVGSRRTISHVAWLGLAEMITLLMLMVVLWEDHREGKRYPWTHWFGIGIRLWFGAVVLGRFVWWIVATWL